MLENVKRQFKFKINENNRENVARLCYMANGFASLIFPSFFFLNFYFVVQASACVLTIFNVIFDNAPVVK